MIRTVRLGAALLSVLALTAGCASGSDDASPTAEERVEAENEVDNDGNAPEDDEAGTSTVESDGAADAGTSEGTEPEDSTEEVGGEPVSVLDFETVEADLPMTYELSPDGLHAAIEVDDGLCLFILADMGSAPASPANAAACVGEVPAFIDLRWSPDSTRVVFVVDSARLVRAGPVQVLGLDGALATIAEPQPGDGDVGELDGAPIHPVFVDDATVAIGRVVGSPPTFEVSVIDLASGAERPVGTIPRPDDSEVWLPRWSWEPSDGDLLVTIGGFDELGTAWILDLESGAASEVAWPSTSPNPDREPNWKFHERSGGVGLTVDVDTFASFGGQSELPGWWLSDLTVPDAAPVGLDVVPSDDSEYVRFATVSPDGATVAVVVVEGDRDDRSVRVLTAATGDVLAGAADWQGVDVPGETIGAFDLTDSFRALTWDEDLVFKNVGLVHRFATG